MQGLMSGHIQNTLKGGDKLRAAVRVSALIGAARTAMKAPVAIIDPHLSWYGEFRFYQVRIYAGDYNVSGVSILGVPFPSLGHSRYCSVAMTTGIRLPRYFSSITHFCKGKSSRRA